MSTSYYRLASPITHLRIDGSGAHDKISIWVSHGLSGILVIPKHETHNILRIFSYDEADDKCPLHTYWGGKERGTVVTTNDESLPDEACVISEYGELLTVGEVKSRDGANRKDGMPTELFGYEKAS